MRFLLITIILIAYGSLYPLEFMYPDDFSIQISKLTDFRFWKSGVSDAIANIFLFIPLGIILQQALKGRLPSTLISLIVLTFIYAYLIQVCQIWTPQRIPYGGDAIWNLIGSMLGATISATSIQYCKNIKLDNDWRQNLPLVIIVCFIVIDLQPFVPTFDVDTIKNNLKTVMFSQDLSIIEIIRHSLFYFIPLTLWRLQFIEVKGARKSLGVLVAVVVVQLFIVNSGIDNNLIVGAILAFAATDLLKYKVTTTTLIHCITTLIVVNALNTFEYRGSVTFNWIPFKPALSGNTLVNIFALLEKSLFYCLFFYFCSQDKIKFKQAVITLTLVIFPLEILQTNIKGATPDITESIVVLFVAYAMWSLIYQNASKNISEVGNKGTFVISRLLLSDSRVRLFLFSLVIAVVAQVLFMSLPNLPYNIVELYNNDGTIIEFTFLFLAVFVVMAGIVWIAINHSTKNISKARLPLFCAYLSIATFLLLQLAVTRESIADINGSSNITYQLTGPRIMGDLGYQVVMILGLEEVKNASQLIEPYIRFVALTGPALYFLTLFLSFFYSLNSYKNTKFITHISYFIKSVCFVLPWLLLCKLISFDFSSTDNLNELIARDGSWGIGGGGYLYALLLIITLTVTYSVYSVNKKRIASVFLATLALILSLPVSWLLLKNGLVDSFQKYGYTFSGVDFLLGPSRSVLLPESELMLRWGGVYVVSVVGIILLMLLAQKFLQVQSIPVEDQLIVNNNVEKVVTHPKTKVTFNKLVLITLLGIGLTIFIGLNLFFDISTKIPKQISWASNDANIIFDHHTHTKFSDGKLTVEELVELGLGNGCDAIAITDHTDSKRSLSKKHLDEIKLARLFNPNILVLAGAELNPPSYKGREHINVLFTPKNEKEAYAGLRNKIDDENIEFDDKQMFELLNTFDVDKGNVVAIYNHPSRKDNDETENKLDYLKWSENSDILIGLSGAPGHQKSENIGSYRGRFKVIERWDPAIAIVGSTLDQLLDEGHDVWGAIASSDYHNEKMDYPPCGFSRIHLSAPEKTYEGLMAALKKGTFWASHGKFLSQFKLVAEVYDKQLRLSPGEAANIDEGSIALIDIELLREADFIALPLEVELITNCVTGKPQLLDPFKVEGFDNNSAALIPINQAGKDGETCYLRSRVKLEDFSGTVNMAYSNHIRFFLN
jgi:hypothetical protein